MSRPVRKTLSNVGARAIEAAISAAEPPTDPLHGLVERTKTDPGTPFEPDVVAQLREMRKDRRADYMRLLDRLKREAEFTKVTDLDKAVRQRDDDGRPNQADQLVALALEHAEFFHTPNGNPHARVKRKDGVRETFRVESNAFKQWLTRSWFRDTGRAPNADALTNAVATLAAHAAEGEVHKVHVRVAPGHIDLGDEQGRAIRIHRGRWKLVENSDVRFIRSPITAALPEPANGGNVDELWRFLNVRDDQDRLLALAWILYAMQDSGPYPAMVVTGDQGSAKSTFLNLERMLVDPRTESLPSLPRNEEDLFIRAAQRHLLAFDNVSKLSDWMSDALCRLAMDGTFSKRESYTDVDETVLTSCNPILLNGITGFVTRPDLAGRSIFLTLAPIPKERRRPEKEMMAEYEAALPSIFGALVDVLAKALQLLPDIHLDEHPRMADFARFGVAVEQVLGLEDGTFMDAYSRNRDGASEDMVEANPIGAVIRNMMADKPEWRGKYEDLLNDLNAELGSAPRPKNWPSSVKALQVQLDSVRPALLAIGIDAPRPQKVGRGDDRGRLLVIRRCAPNDEATPIRASAPRDRQPPKKVNGFHYNRSSPAVAEARRQRRESQEPDTTTSRARKDVH